MTDPTPAAEPAKSLFEMVPTSEAYMQLAAQVADIIEDVEHLQASTPAIPDDETTPDDSTDTSVLSARLDRHRTEIEEIKKRYNALIRYLGSTDLPAAQPADISATSTGDLQ